jgi:urea transporter
MNLSFVYSGKRFLHSFSQVMLQENAFTGLLFLIAIWLNSPTMLLGSLIATLSGLAAAKACKLKISSQHSGLYGFNAVLVGLVISYYLPVNFISLTLVVLSGAFATVLMYLMITRLTDIPALTTPFILTSWLILMLIEHIGISREVHSAFSDANSMTIVDYALASLRGIAQVMLQDYWLSGALIFCALAYNSAKTAVCALLGSALGTLIALCCNFSQEAILMGGYGFNSCLVSIALTSLYPRKYWLTLLGIFVAVLLTRAFEQVSLPALTAPFVVTIWLINASIKVVVKYTEEYSKQ